MSALSRSTAALPQGSHGAGGVVGNGAGRIVKPMIAAVVAAIAMACAPAAQAPTPIVGNLEAVPDGDGGTLAIVARVTVGGFIVGFALSCEDGRPLATVYLGPFPPRLQALQLATRTAGGAVTRFGPVFRADAASGFHSPQLVEDDLDEFLRAVLAPGTLVSNGHNSYRVQLTPTDRMRVTTFLEACGR